jgi:hypothetical protein
VTVNLGFATASNAYLYNSLSNLAVANVGNWAGAEFPATGTNYLYLALGIIPANWTGVLIVDTVGAVEGNNQGAGIVRPLYATACFSSGADVGSGLNALTYNTDLIGTMGVSGLWYRTPYFDNSETPSVAGCSAGQEMVLRIGYSTATTGNTAVDRWILSQVRYSLPYTI